MVRSRPPSFVMEREDLRRGDGRKFSFYWFKRRKQRL